MLEAMVSFSGESSMLVILKIKLSAIPLILKALGAIKWEVGSTKRKRQKQAHVQFIVLAVLTYTLKK